MKVKITLCGEGCCSTIKECTKEQYKFLESIIDTMGDDEDESYSPCLSIDEVYERYYGR